jgi:hypothetical protein
MGPFDFWTGAWRNATSLTQAGLKFTEMASASKTVIECRSRTICSAMADPMTADYGELGRMVPEKMLAISQAGMAVLEDMRAWQVDAWAQWQQVTGLAMAGGLPSLAQMEEASSRSMRMANRLASAGGKALAPIHETAIANARRLSS